MLISPIGIEITKRFFEAIDMLIASKKLRGLQTFTKAHDINRRNLQHLRESPSNTILKPEILYYIVSDYGISAKWLITGQGSMFEHIESAATLTE